ncbi:MAG: DUF4112 domain-containing protein [Planctomycetota bacterium JB042]
MAEADPAGPPATGTAADRHAELERTRRLARLLDAEFRLPGTRFRFGLDPLLGLVPGVGDALSAALSGHTIWRASRLGVPGRVLRRMIRNVLVDLLLGAIPLVGDVLDFFVRANRKNLALLEAHLESAGASANTEP